jgi:hypothetical protein
MDSERWAVIPGSNGDYEVSDLGRVRSWRRRGGRRAEPRLRSLNNVGGYRQVELQGAGLWTIHRLVLTAFVGPCPPGCEASHINGDRADNRLANLVWETHAENMRRVPAHRARRVAA